MQKHQHKKCQRTRNAVLNLDAMQAVSDTIRPVSSKYETLGAQGTYLSGLHSPKITYTLNQASKISFWQPTVR